MCANGIKLKEVCESEEDQSTKNYEVLIIPKPKITKPWAVKTRNLTTVQKYLELGI